MRLIDLDDLLKELEEWEADLYDTNPKRQLGITDAIVIACQMPTVDAVPVIRCKDCRFSKIIDEENDWFECQHDKRVLHSDGYCSWAERKEE